MKRLLFRALLAAPFFLLLSPSIRADEPQLSPERLDMLDKRGYFTPGFKAGVHDYIDTKKALEQAEADEKQYSDQYPDLSKQSDAAKAKTDGLRKELAKYQHPDDEDYAQLQAALKNPAAKPEDQLVLAEAFIWAYPSNGKVAEVQQDLQDIQKKLADQAQAMKAAQAAQAAAEAKLLQRVQARDLSIDEWKVFLLEKSQEEVIKYLGRADYQQGGYWVYKSAYSVDPVTNQKVGLNVGFNGTRVDSVSAGPAVTSSP